MKIKLIVASFLVTLSGYSQSKKWENNLVVSYKMTDKTGKPLNSIVVKKDTVHYQWLEKDKIASKILVGDTALENKLIGVMDKHKILKFKSAKPATPGPNIVFVHSKADKEKTIVMPQQVKAGSKEELFVKEFLEPILLKVFAQELKNFPK